MRWLGGLVSFAASAGVAQAPAAPGALAPSGKWIVDYAENMCVLQRSYGGAEGVTLGFRPIPLSDEVELVVSRPAADRQGYRVGSGRVTVDGRETAAGYETNYLEGTKRRLVTYSAEIGIDDVLAATELTISGDGRGALKVAPGGSAAAKAAIGKCQDDLLAAWGVDVAALKALRRNASAIRPIHQLFSPNDYPADAVLSKQQGRVVALMTVGPDGRVTACRTPVGATPLLDRTTCTILTERVRFSPALTAAGLPTQGWSMVAIRWQAPG